MTHSPNSNPDERSPRLTRLTEPNRDNRYSYNHNQQDNQEMSQSRQGNSMTADKQRSLITYNHITYLLNIISYFTAGLLWIVPIVMHYIKRHEADGTWLATHFDWQIKTFWYSIVGFAVGVTLIAFAVGGLGVSMMADSGNGAIGSFLFIGLGLLIMVFTFIWHLYRIIRGWIALTDNRPVP